MTDNENFVKIQWKCFPKEVKISRAFFAVLNRVNL